MYETGRSFSLVGTLWGKLTFCGAQIYQDRFFYIDGKRRSLFISYGCSDDILDLVHTTLSVC